MFIFFYSWQSSVFFVGKSCKIYGSNSSNSIFQFLWPGKVGDQQTVQRCEQNQFVWPNLLLYTNKQAKLVTFLLCSISLYFQKISKTFFPWLVIFSTIGLSCSQKASQLQKKKQIKKFVKSSIVRWRQPLRSLSCF